MVYHISHLGEHDLAIEMMGEQVSNNWPGLANEVRLSCEEMGIEGPWETDKGRQEYNRMVKDACRREDEACMREEMVKMKKMKIMYQDGLDMKEYVKNGTLYSARRTWQVRSNMLDLASNFPNHSK